MDTEFARHQMLVHQVRAFEVNDLLVLDVMSDVARENFVPAGFRNLAFADTEIPLGHGQRMMTPIVEGRMLQSLMITPGDSVLEIGTGSAYITACLAKLASSVYSLDVFDDFLSLAATKLKHAGIANVELACMDASRELPDGEFNAIAVTASLPLFDPRYVSALRPGGRLFVVVGESPVQEARLIVRNEDSDWTSTALFETDLPPLVNFPIRNRFRF
ncbi:MAG: protein-L-isoaspartate O-methyltransferase [Nitrospirales bacterium]